MLPASGTEPAGDRRAGQGLLGGVMGEARAESDFSPPLDEGIRAIVECLSAANVETFESCQGGVGHAYPEPTVRFHGDRPEGYRALGIALCAGFRVSELRRVWPLLDGELTGPHWEITLISPVY